MGTERSMFVGFTDYSGVPFEDVIEHFKDWNRFATQQRRVLTRLRLELEALPASGPVRVGLGHLSYCDDVFRRAEYECARLAGEMPLGVEARHLEAIRQLLGKFREADDACVHCKNDLHLYAAGEGEPQATLAELYRESRDTILFYMDLSNTISRLATFVGALAPVVPSSTGIRKSLLTRVHERLEIERRKRGLLWVVGVTILGLILAVLAL